MWIKREGISNSLAVFIHGFTGTSWRTWDDFPRRLQERNDRTTNSYHIFLFEYPSSWLKQPPIHATVLKLREFLTGVGPQYDTIVLIAHSQGGIIAKLCIIDALLNGEGQQLKVDLVITCATPHKGILLCNIPYLLHGLPFGGQVIQCEQLCDLASWGGTIRKLKDHWNDRLIAPLPCPAQASRRHIKSIAVAYRERIVSAQSASGFWIDTADLRAERHHGMTTDKLDSLFYEYLEQHGNPASIISELARLSAEETLLEAFFKAQIPLVIKATHNKFPNFEHFDEPSALLLVRAFVAEYPRRPLRCVNDISDAVTRYVTRKLGEVL